MNNDSVILGFVFLLATTSRVAVRSTQHPLTHCTAYIHTQTAKGSILLGGGRYLHSMVRTKQTAIKPMRGLAPRNQLQASTVPRSEQVPNQPLKHRFTSLKPQVSSNTYWRNRLHLSHERLNERKDLVFDRLRAKWKKRDKLSKGRPIDVSNMKDWLLPLIKRWNAEEEATAYVRWALFFMLHLGQRKLFGKGGADTDLASRSMSTGHTRIAGSVHEAHVKVEDTVEPGSTRDTPLRISPAPDHTPIAQQGTLGIDSHIAAETVNWDQIEVCINASILDLGVIWLPIITLKPEQKASKRCAWYDFNLDDLKREFQSETSIKLDLQTHDIIYTSSQGPFTFNRTGGYRIALKRFAEAGGSPDNILQLEIVAAEKQDQAKGDRVRARPQFMGQESDYSDNEQETRHPAQKRQRTG